MALLNRQLKFQDADTIPLIDSQNNQVLSNFNVDVTPDSDDKDTEEVSFQRHDITLWVTDAIILLVEQFQFYAVLLAMSEHWGWPIQWVNSTAFAFIFNFDIWEFRKVETGAFNHSRSSFVDTKNIGFNYMSYIASWAVILCIICSAFGIVYYRWMKNRPLYLLLYVSRWKRTMFLVFQFIAIPFGIAAVRIFHCREDIFGTSMVMDVQSEIKCYSVIHIMLMVLIGIVFLCLFIIYPLILSKWVYMQVFSGDPLRHEGYLQLKEAEYEQGLDSSWDINQYHLFSSFQRSWVLYNPLKFFFKLLFIAAFAASVHSTFWSSAMITVLFAISTLAYIAKRPFRVNCFNIMIIINHLIIAANALIGNFMVRPPWENVQTFEIVAFLRYPTIMHILQAFNLFWIGCVAIWVVYLVLLNNGFISKRRVWPRLSYEASNKIGEDTKKYLKAALKARITLEKALAFIPLFAPVHDLSHQIKVINAYSRETEYIGDPTHDTLWDLLDELIEAHNSLVKVSVFGMSGKNSVKETSEEFIKLMPSFRKRLKQREYDLVLVAPIKRRLLLKMYILSTFISNAEKGNCERNDVSLELHDSLALLDTKSLDDDISSISPSSRAFSQMNFSRGESSMSVFLNEVEKIGQDDETSEPTSSTSRSSTSNLLYPPASARSDNFRWTKRKLIGDSKVNTKIVPVADVGKTKTIVSSSLKVFVLFQYCIVKSY